MAYDYPNLFDIDPNHVSATPALIDIFPLDIVLTEMLFQGIEEIRLRVSMGFVSNEVHMIPSGGVLDRLDRVAFDQLTVIRMVRFFEVGRPGIGMNPVGHGFAFLVGPFMGR